MIEFINSCPQNQNQAWIIEQKKYLCCWNRMKLSRHCNTRGLQWFSQSLKQRERSIRYKKTITSEKNQIKMVTNLNTNRSRRRASNGSSPKNSTQHHRTKSL